MIKVLRFVGGVIALILLGLFLAPCFFSRVLNIGNLTGIVLSVLLLVYMIGMPWIHRGIAHLWTKRCWRIPLTIVGGFAALCAALAVVETLLIVGSCMKEPMGDATAVVLGCRVYGDHPSLSLANRLEAAYEYLTENPEADCIVTGGQGPDETMSEAECMYLWLVDKGIEPSRIYKEDRATSTEENIAFSKEIIEEEGLFPKIAVITSEYHTYRAGRIAGKNDMTWGAYPGHTEWWLLPTFYVRELYAILAEWLV